MICTFPAPPKKNITSHAHTHNRYAPTVKRLTNACTHAHTTVTLSQLRCVQITHIPLLSMASTVKGSPMSMRNCCISSTVSPQKCATCHSNGYVCPNHVVSRHTLRHTLPKRGRVGVTVVVCQRTCYCKMQVPLSPCMHGLAACRHFNIKKKRGATPSVRVQVWSVEEGVEDALLLLAAF